MESAEHPARSQEAAAQAALMQLTAEPWATWSSSLGLPSLILNRDAYMFTHVHFSSAVLTTILVAEGHPETSQRPSVIMVCPLPGDGTFVLH